MRIARALQFCLFAGLSAVAAAFLLNAGNAALLTQVFHDREQPVSVVRVTAEHTNNVNDLGSGVLIRSDLVLTAHHVIRDVKSDSKVIITFRDGLTREGKVIRSSRKWDLAIVQFESVLHTPARPAKQAAVKGQDITIAGFPGGGDYAEVEGHIIGFRSPDRFTQPWMFLISDRCESGMSGGPAFNGNGEVVGILFGSLVYANCTGLDAIRGLIDAREIPRQDRGDDDSPTFSPTDGRGTHEASP